jgi:hypothetical protein
MIKYVFIVLSIGEIILFQLFPPIASLICRSQSAFNLSLLTPFILRHSNFVKLLARAKKSFKKFQEIVKKVYGDMTLKRTPI